MILNVNGHLPMTKNIQITSIELRGLLWGFPLRGSRGDREFNSQRRIFRGKSISVSVPCSRYGSQQPLSLVFELFSLPSLLSLSMKTPQGALRYPAGATFLDDARTFLLARRLSVPRLPVASASLRAPGAAVAKLFLSTLPKKLFDKALTSSSSS